MKTDGAGKYQPVGLSHPAVQLNLNAAGGFSQIGQLAGVITVVIGDPDPAVQGAQDFLMFVLGLSAVDTEGYDYFHVPVPDSRGVKPLHQEGEIYLASGIAGDVRSDDYHPLAGLEAVHQRQGLY